MGPTQVVSGVRLKMAHGILRRNQWDLSRDDIDDAEVSLGRLENQAPQSLNQVKA